MTARVTSHSAVRATIVATMKAVRAFSVRAFSVRSGLIRPMGPTGHRKAVRIARLTTVKNAPTAAGNNAPTVLTSRARIITIVAATGARADMKAVREDSTARAVIARMPEAIAVKEGMAAIIIATMRMATARGAITAKADMAAGAGISARITTGAAIVVRSRADTATTVMEAVARNSAARDMTPMQNTASRSRLNTRSSMWIRMRRSA